MSMPAEVIVEVNEEVKLPGPLSWRAILAGVAVALAVQLILSILGAAIGLGLVDPRSSDNPDATLVGVVAMIWWTLSGILSAYAGGIAAGRLSGRPATAIAGWHGLVAWAVTVLFIFWLLTTAIGSVVGGAFNLLGSAVGAVATGATAAVPAVAAAADPFADIETGIQDSLGAQDPTAARGAVVGYVRAALSANEAGQPAALDRAADALARATRTSPEEAKARITEWQTQYNQTVETAKAKAAEAADAARKAAAGAGIISVIALVFGALAGWYGGLNSPLPEREIAFTRFGRREMRAG